MDSRPDRRQFLRRSAVSAAAAAFTGAVALPAYADPLGLPIGIQLYTVGADLQKDAAATLARLAAIGYKEVETAGFGSAGSAAALRKLFDANGLRCPSAHLSFDMKNLNKAFDDALALGCKYATSSVPRMLIMPPMDPNSPDAAKARQEFMRLMRSPLSADDVKRMIEAINQVATAAKKQGLMFGSHNHGFEFVLIDGRPAIYSMIEKTDASSVKFEIDCGWTAVSGFDAVDIAKAYPGRVKMLHIKDFYPIEKKADGTPGATLGSEIGQGFVNYKKIFAGMKGLGIEHIFVEQEGPYSRIPPMAAAKVDYDFLHSL